MFWAAKPVPDWETWLKSHPGVKVISRDRAGAYAEGAANGAPGASQMADRFHLLCSLTSAVERSLESKRTQLRAVAATAAAEPSSPQPTEASPQAPARITRAEQRKQERRQQRLDRYNQVVALHRQGVSQKEISSRLHLERKTVRRFLRAGKFPERATPRRRPPRVDAFREHIEQRWEEGCHNATQLWHEIQSRGYKGGRSMVTRLVATFCSTARTPAVTRVAMRPSRSTTSCPLDGRRC